MYKQITLSELTVSHLLIKMSAWVSMVFYKIFLVILKKGKVWGNNLKDTMIT